MSIPENRPSATPAGDAADPAAPPHAEQPDRDASEAGARLWMTPGRVYEFRGLGKNPGGPPTVYAGRVDDPAAVGDLIQLAAANRVDPYLTLNPLAPGAGGSLPLNDVEQARYGQCVGDADIIDIERLLADLDPVRPKGTAATAGEREAAVTLGWAIRDHLLALGAPAPAVFATPNGAAVHVRAALSAGDAGVVKRFLGGLGARFDGEAVKVDPVVYNPGRIGRPPGSVGHKGPGTADRPHRVCRLLSPGDPDGVTSRFAIEQIAAKCPAGPPRPAGDGRRGPRGPARGGAGWMSRRGLDLFVAEHLPGADGPHPWDNGRRWVLPVCPWDPDHDDRAAFVVQLRSGAVQAGCHHDGCAGLSWRDLLDDLAPGVPDGTPPCIAAARVRARGSSRTRRR